ncbi:MAG: Gfo/Idh/MocA family protein [Gammaproteobacteria bacterium]
MQPIKCAVIGVGHLGKYHAEKYAASKESELVAVCDTNYTRTQEIANHHHVAAFSDYHALLGLVTAVSIVTPTTSHHTIAKFFLSQGVHVFVEKPMTMTVEEADELINISEKNNLVLQVGHIERFNPAIVACKPLIQNPTYIETQRLSPFNPRCLEVNVVLDLMIHDIDLIKHIVPAKITEIHATGASIITNDIDIANARIQFDNGCIANLNASRVSHVTERNIKIYHQKSYIFADLKDRTLLTFQKNNHEMHDVLNTTHPVENYDALHDELTAFLHAIKTQTKPLISGVDGRTNLSIALAITHHIEKKIKLAEFA